MLNIFFGIFDCLCNGRGKWINDNIKVVKNGEIYSDI